MYVLGVATVSCLGRTYIDTYLQITRGTYGLSHPRILVMDKEICMYICALSTAGIGLYICWSSNAVCCTSPGRICVPRCSSKLVFLSTCTGMHLPFRTTESPLPCVSARVIRLTLSWGSSWYYRACNLGIIRVAVTLLGLVHTRT